MTGYPSLLGAMALGRIEAGEQFEICLVAVFSQPIKDSV
jgi:hypothetical protein